jgi:hypothetical protein
MARKKAYFAEQLLLFSYPAAWLASRQGGESDHRPPYPPPFVCYPYFTQIEGVVALGPSIRLGLNIGELLDFVVGWAGLDIYGDDLEIPRPNGKR